MSKFFEKARAVLKLLEGYCLRVAKAFKVVGAVFNFLQSESYEMQELTEQLMLQAMAEWESVENKIKIAKEEITKKGE
jgi:hypothetical protein